MFIIGFIYNINNILFNFSLLVLIFILLITKGEFFIYIFFLLFSCNLAGESINVFKRSTFKRKWFKWIQSNINDGFFPNFFYINENFDLNKSFFEKSLANLYWSIFKTIANKILIKSLVFIYIFIFQLF